MRLACHPLVLGLRSVAFWAMLAASTVSFGLLLLPAAVLPVRARFALAATWARLNIGALRLLCGVDYRVEGREHLPGGAAIVLAKHQSSWETLAFPFLLPPQVFVLKRELLRIPFFGWGLALVQNIAIDRRAGRSAVQQVVEQGRDRLARGRWVVVFPEGTRVAPGQKRRYKMGGAILAAETGYPVVPVAHNAGHFWPRHRFIKRPGCITVRIGPPIDPRDRSPAEINAAAEAWIEAQMPELDARARASLARCGGGCGG